jgi:hypothetical protein
VLAGQNDSLKGLEAKVIATFRNLYDHADGVAGLDINTLPLFDIDGRNYFVGACCS